MNIESTSVNKTARNAQVNHTSQQNSELSVKFSDESKELEAEKAPEKEQVKESESKETDSKKEVEPKETDEKDDIKGAIDELSGVVEEINQLDDKDSEKVKKDGFLSDNNDMINNDFNVENKDKLPQMNPGMSFNSNGQPFSSFMNEDVQKSLNNSLSANVADLAEEAAILSTMAENIAMANRNNMLNNEKTVINNDGVKKVDTKTGITTENIVKFDSIIMNEADVEVFVQLVQNGSVEMNNIAPQAAEKSVQVSKALADMLAKSMETGQPVRIDFDNNISVIIRISRDGKITADFLPSSQIAEAYLKENLPLLRQKFDNENIKYDELNQRERKEHHREQERKKGRNDE